MGYEMNFVERLLDNGFERYVNPAEKNKGRFDMMFNPKNGWMGVIVYHPYERFSKGAKTVELSLERFGVTDILYKDGLKKEEQINEKHITVKINDEMIYHNKYGVLPSKEIQQKLYAD